MTFALCYGTTTATSHPPLEMIRAHHGYTVTAGQLLPLSWNGRRVKSPFNRRLLCPCIKSKGIRGTEWTHRHMIVLAEYECINIVLLSQQELFIPHCSNDRATCAKVLHNCEETKSDCVLLWFDIWTWGGNTKSEKRSVIILRSSQVWDYNLIELIVL